MGAVTPAQKLRWLNALCKDRRISASEFRIAYQIANHINNSSGKAWPGRRRLAETTALSTRTAQRCIRKLIQLGCILQSQRRGRTCLYELILDEGEKVDPLNQPSAIRDAAPGQLARGSGVACVSQTYQQNTGITSLGDAALLLANVKFAQRRKAEEGRGILDDPKRAQWEARILRMLGPGGAEVMNRLPKSFLKYLLANARSGQLSAADVSKARAFAENK